MKRLLIVTPFFPPHPSPATHRARFLARYAPDRGWNVEILTVDPVFFEDEPDFELLRLVPKDLVIHRTAALPSKLTRVAGVGDLAIRSYMYMRRALGRLIRDRKPDLLYFPGGPFFQFQLGPRVRRRFGTPYVLDYTDPWVFPLRPEQNDFRKKIFWARQLAALLEPTVVRSAAHVFAVSDGTNDTIRHNYPDIPVDRFSAVPFGFEPSDFDTLREHPRPNRFWDRSDGLIHLVYVGAMLPNGHETVRALFAAVNNLRARVPALGTRLRLHFFGTTYDPFATSGLVLPEAIRAGLADVVSEHPRRIPYLDALNVLTSADVVLALGSSEIHYTASKIFPCLLSGRPVFAAYHEASTVGEIVRAAGVGNLVTYSDETRAEARVEEFTAALRAAIENTEGTLRHNAPALAAFSAEAMTGHIFDIMDRIVSVPSQGDVPLTHTARG